MCPGPGVLAKGGPIAMCRGQVEGGQSRPEREVWVSVEEPWPRSSDCVPGTVGSLWVASKGRAGSARWFRRTALTAGENKGNRETREAGGCGHQMPVGDPARTEGLPRALSPPDSVTWGGLTSPGLWFCVCKMRTVVLAAQGCCGFSAIPVARQEWVRRGQPPGVMAWHLLYLEAVLRKCGGDDPPTFLGASG